MAQMIWDCHSLQDNSLLTMPPWRNPWLLVAEAASFLCHFAILYIPFLVSLPEGAADICSCSGLTSLASPPIEVSSRYPIHD